MSDSVLIERAITGDPESATAISDVPLEAASGGDVPNVGTVLDERYEITGLLGQGGMGLVLGARHVVLGQRLAIKVLRREMTRDAEIVERFRREAKAASAIGHTGIVAVKDFGSLPSGASYYVMEHVDGVSLADALAQERQFTIARAVDVVSQMADALGAAHAAGVVHRDVKPENVLLTSFHGRPDHVKLLDFGIAKLDFASRLSGAHRVLGTPAYMSPEQARGQKLDHRCDVYALGIVLYELLAGDVPFDDKRPLEVLRQQIHTPAPSVKLIRPDAPDEIVALIASCLEKSPEARPASMQSVVERLAPFVTPRSSASSSGASTPTPAPRSTPRPALPSISVTPIAVSSRNTPIASTPSAMPGPWATLAAGIVLSIVGVIALAAAGGILMREHVDEEAVAPVTAPVPTAAPAVVAAPPVAEPEVASPPPTSIAVTPAVPITAPLPAHLAHPMHPRAVVAPSEPASTVVAPAPAPEHPTIRVIDPWDDP
jgi:serine/threonine protein kinase